MSMRTLFIILILTTAIIACEGKITYQVPAIVGNDGSLVRVTMEMTNGNGATYVTISPRIGLATQDSIEDAIDYAYRLSEKEDECDILVTFDTLPQTNYIDGPSAGAAISVIAYALIDDKTLRDDTLITGAIDKNGNIGPVGGTYEKAKSAANNGAKYFISPIGDLYEHLLMEKLEERYDITVLEVERIEEIIAFMTENTMIEDRPLISRKRDIPELIGYDAHGLEEFEPVARKMIQTEETVLNGIPKNNNETAQIAEFFENEKQRQEIILNKGYYFSAANEAFLNYIEINTITALLLEQASLVEKKYEIEDCLDEITSPEITDENFEWVIGSDLRRAWAQDKLDKTDIRSETFLYEEQFIKYNELMYADAWCNVAKGLTAATTSSGQTIDEKEWKELAEETIQRAKFVGTTTPETQSRLVIAENLYISGKYGAAIYDATYVITMEQTTQELSISNLTIQNEVTEMVAKKPTALWATVYHSHGSFLYEINQTEAAYKTLRFAHALDEITYKMINLTSTTQNTEPLENKNSILYASLTAISLFLFILVIIILRRVYGDNCKGTGKTDRTKKKKG